MSNLGTYVIYLIMACAIIGAFAAIKNSDKGVGREFMEGLHSVGYIFVPATPANMDEIEDIRDSVRFNAVS
jgi:ethanolamine transporter